MKTDSLIRNINGFLICGLIILGGCARVPQKAILGADAALDSARSIEADHYAEKQFILASVLADSAQVLLNREKSRFIFSRNYSEVQKILFRAQQAAIEARDSATLQKQKYQTEIKNIIEQNQVQTSRLRGLLNACGKKDPSLALFNDLAMADTLNSNAIITMNNGAYIDAKNIAFIASDKLIRIKTDIDALAPAPKRKKHR